MCNVLSVGNPTLWIKLQGFLQKPPDLEAHVTIVQFGNKKCGLSLIFIRIVCTVVLSYII